MTPLESELRSVQKTGNKYEDYNQYKSVLERFLPYQGVSADQMPQVIESLLGPEPIEEAGFVTKTGRSLSRGADLLQQNVGALAEYGGELSGLEGLKQYGSQLYEEQAKQLEAQRPAYSTEDPGFGDYIQMGAESMVGTAPLAAAPAIGFAALPAGLGAGIAAGTAAGIFSNAALEGGTTYSALKRELNPDGSKKYTEDQVLEIANRIAMDNAVDPELLLWNVVQAISPAKIIPTAGRLTKLGVGVTQQATSGGLQEGRQYEVSEARTKDPRAAGPAPFGDRFTTQEGQTSMIVGALSEAPFAALDVAFDDRSVPSDNPAPTNERREIERRAAEKIRMAAAEEARRGAKIGEDLLALGVPEATLTPVLENLKTPDAATRESAVLELQRMLEAKKKELGPLTKAELPVGTVDIGKNIKDELVLVDRTGKRYAQTKAGYIPQTNPSFTEVKFLTADEVAQLQGQQQVDKQTAKEIETQQVQEEKAAAAQAKSNEERSLYWQRRQSFINRLSESTEPTPILEVSFKQYSARAKKLANSLIRSGDENNNPDDTRLGTQIITELQQLTKQYRELGKPPKQKKAKQAEKAAPVGKTATEEELGNLRTFYEEAKSYYQNAVSSGDSRTVLKNALNDLKKKAYRYTDALYSTNRELANEVSRELDRLVAATQKPKTKQAKRVEAPADATTAVEPQAAAAPTGPEPPSVVEAAAAPTAEPDRKQPPKQAPTPAPISEDRIQRMVGFGRRNPDELQKLVDSRNEVAIEAKRILDEEVAQQPAVDGTQEVASEQPEVAVPIPAPITDEAPQQTADQAAEGTQPPEVQPQEVAPIPEPITGDAQPDVVEAAPVPEDQAAAEPQLTTTEQPVVEEETAAPEVPQPEVEPTPTPVEPVEGEVAPETAPEPAPAETDAERVRMPVRPGVRRQPSERRPVKLRRDKTWIDIVTESMPDSSPVAKRIEAVRDGGGEPLVEAEKVRRPVRPGVRKQAGERQPVKLRRDEIWDDLVDFTGWFVNSDITKGRYTVPRPINEVLKDIRESRGQVQPVKTVPQQVETDPQQVFEDFGEAPSMEELQAIEAELQKERDEREARYREDEKKASQMLKGLKNFSMAWYEENAPRVAEFAKENENAFKELVLDTKGLFVSRDVETGEYSYILTYQEPNEKGKPEWKFRKFDPQKEPGEYERVFAKLVDEMLDVRVEFEKLEEENKKREAKKEAEAQAELERQISENAEDADAIRIANEKDPESIDLTKDKDELEKELAPILARTGAPSSKNKIEEVAERYGKDDAEKDLIRRTANRIKPKFANAETKGLKGKDKVVALLNRYNSAMAGEVAPEDNIIDSLDTAGEVQLILDSIAKIIEKIRKATGKEKSIDDYYFVSRGENGEIKNVSFEIPTSSKKKISLKLNRDELIDVGLIEQVDGVESVSLPEANPENGLSFLKLEANYKGSKRFNLRLALNDNSVRAKAAELEKGVTVSRMAMLRAALKKAGIPKELNQYIIPKLKGVQPFREEITPEQQSEILNKIRKEAVEKEAGISRDEKDADRPVERGGDEFKLGTTGAEEAAMPMIPQEAKDQYERDVANLGKKGFQIIGQQEVNPLIAELEEQISEYEAEIANLDPGKDQETIEAYQGVINELNDQIEQLRNEGEAAPRFSFNKGEKLGGVLTAKQLNSVIEAFTENFGKLTGRVKAFRNRDEAIAELTKMLKDEKNQQAIQSINNTIGVLKNKGDISEAFVIGGQVYLLANNIKGKNQEQAISRAVEVLFHEGVGHYGLKNFMGDSFSKFIDDVGRNPMNKALISKWLKTEKGKEYSSQPYSVQVEEYIAANFAEFGIKRVSFIERMAQAIRSLLGMGRGTETAIKQALVRSSNELRAGAQGNIVSGQLFGDTFGGRFSFDGRESLEDQLSEQSVSDRQAQEAVKEKLSVSPGTLTSAIAERAKSISNWAHKISDPYNTLPEEKRFIRLRQALKAKMGLIVDMAEDVNQIFRNTDEGKTVYNFLTTRDADPNSIKDQKVRETAIRVKQTFDQIGEALIRQGMASPEQIGKYKGMYLPRMYLKYLLGDDTKGDYIPNNLSASDQRYLKRRMDENQLPEYVRKFMLQEIEDPGYLASKGILTAGKDIAVIDFLNTVAMNPNWAWQDAMVKVNIRDIIMEAAGGDPVGEALVERYGAQNRVEDWLVTTNYLRSEADRLSKFVAPAAEGTEKAILENLIKRFNELAEGVERDMNIQKLPGDYAQIPDTKKYGKLRGMYVRKEIYDEITSSLGTITADAGKISVALEKMQAFNSFFKISKTALNLPAGHIRNLISAAQFAYFAGVKMHRLAPALVEAIREVRRNGEFYRDAKEQFGLFTSGIVPNEMNIIESEFLADAQLKVARGKADGNIDDYLKFAWLLLKSKTNKGMKGASKIYQYGDDIMRLVVFMELQKDGKSATEAAYEADKWIMDYSKVTKGVRYLRQASLGAPFITYTAKAAPLMLEVFLTKPWKMAPYFALGYGLQEAAKNAFDWDDDDYDAVVQGLAPWLKDKADPLAIFPPLVVPAPWKDAEGRPQFLDLSYMFPFGLFSEIATDLNKFGKALAGDPTGDAGGLFNIMKTVGLGGGPGVSMISAASTGVDPFTQQPVVDPSSVTPGEKISDWGKYLWGLAMPPMFNMDFGAIKKMSEAYSGENINRYGDPTNTMGQAIGKFFGLGGTPVDPQLSRAMNIKRMKSAIDKQKSLMRQELRLAIKKGYTPEQRNDLRNEYTEKIVFLKNQMNDYIKSTASLR